MLKSNTESCSAGTQVLVFFCLPVKPAPLHLKQAMLHEVFLTGKSCSFSQLLRAFLALSTCCKTFLKVLLIGKACS